MRTLAVVPLLAALASAHGARQPSPPPKPPPKRRFERPPEPPPPPPEHDPEAPINPPTTPPGDPAPPPGPVPPGPHPIRPTTRPGVRPAVRGRRTAGAINDWRIFWELNREHLVGIRGLLRERGPVTGLHGDTRRDPLGDHRAEALAALRTIIGREEDRTVRAASIVALSRMGTDEDSRLFLLLLRHDGEPKGVREAAAIGLGLLPPPREAATRKTLRDHLLYYVKYPQLLPERVRGLAILSAGLCSRDDPALRMALVGLAASHLPDGEEAANLAFACGLIGDPIVAPELLRAARKGRMAGQRLSDIERAHAVQALALIPDRNVVGTLAAVLRSRKSGLQTRRAAALALGRILRETSPGADGRKIAQKALLDALERSNDATLTGFTAVALGGARPPLGVDQLKRVIDHGGMAEAKPYCALALGLAARALKAEDRGRRIRTFLLGELGKTRNIEIASALLISLGLAGADEAADVLLKRTQKKSLPPDVRAAAAQGLGLLGRISPEAQSQLIAMLKTETGPVLEDAILALGLLGKGSIAHDLAAMIPKTTSAQVQGRLILALGRLDHPAAVEPLLKILRDRKARPLVREFAAAALGILGNRRERDTLFDLEGYFNWHATTRATNEMLRLY